MRMRKNKSNEQRPMTFVLSFVFNLQTQSGNWTKRILEKQAAVSWWRECDSWSRHALMLRFLREHCHWMFMWQASSCYWHLWVCVAEQPLALVVGWWRRLSFWYLRCWTFICAGARPFLWTLSLDEFGITTVGWVSPLHKGSCCFRIWTITWVMIWMYLQWDDWLRCYSTFLCNWIPIRIDIQLLLQSDVVKGLHSEVYLNPTFLQSLDSYLATGETTFLLHLCLAGFCAHGVLWA